MIQLIRSLIAPFISLILLIAASGLANTFISVRLELEGFNTDSIGIVTASLYLGIFIGSLWIDRWISKIGHIKAFVYCALLCTFLVLAQSVYVDPYYWAFLRFIGGICTAGIFIVIESWLLMQAGPKLRGAILSIYLAVFYMALSGGQLLIHLSNPLGLGPFYIIAILSAVSIVPLVLKRGVEPKIESKERLKTKELFRLSPFGLSGVVLSGIILAAVYGLVPVYAKEMGLSVSEIGNLMALLIFGGLSFQWPLGRLADKGHRKKVLIGSSLLTTILSLGIALFGDVSHAVLYPLIFLFGGFSFTIYPLSMAYACEKISDDQIVSATGGFVLAYGIGAIMGPLLAPMAMDRLGSNGVFLFIASISLLLTAIGFSQKEKALSKIGEDER